MSEKNISQPVLSTVQSIIVLQIYGIFAILAHKVFSSTSKICFTQTYTCRWYLKAAFCQLAKLGSEKSLDNTYGIFAGEFAIHESPATGFLHHLCPAN